MAQIINHRKCEGVCEKIFNAISGGRKSRLISHHVHAASVSSETAPKSQVQATGNPAKASFLNQPSYRMIPIEFEPSTRPSPKTQKENMQPAAKNTAKEDGTKHVSEVSVQDLAKTKAAKEKAIQEKGYKDNKTVPKSAKNKFSDYIDHVKNKMGTVQKVDGDGDGDGGGGGGGGGKTGTRRDSFNDKTSESAQI